MELTQDDTTWIKYTHQKSLDDASSDTSIDVSTSDKFMLIDCDAMSSLDILDDDRTKSKEQITCLFDILNQCRSPQGKHLMRQWFLRPLVVVEDIVRRQDAVEFCLLQQHQVLVDAMSSHVTKLKNIPTIFNKLRMGSEGISDWQALLQFCHHAVAIEFQMQQLLNRQQQLIFDKGSSSLLASVMQAFDVKALQFVVTQIIGTIDFDESDAKERIVIRHHVDAELDNMKQMYAGLETLLSEMAWGVSHQLDIANSAAGLLNAVYIPRFGFLLSMPLEDAHGIASTRGWTVVFSNEGLSYYKSEEMREIDDKLGDIHSLITEREIEILQKLQESVLKYAAQLMKASEALARLDCILALASAARSNQYQRPTLTNGKELRIVRSRHPVYAQNVTNFVENDATMCVDLNQDDSIMVVTGANYSGKSVYIKQIAVICFMAQIGSFVPAESARIGIVDRMFTRIQTKEMSSKPESVYAYDVHQAMRALELSTAGSMIVLDEFGKGTRSTDGAALFIGVLGNLLKRGSNCPRVLAATHFHEALNSSYLPTWYYDNAKIAYFQMPLLENNEVTYLYKLVPGKCTAALGLRLAEKMELYDGELLARAALGVQWFAMDGKTGHLDMELFDGGTEYNSFKRLNLEESDETREQLRRVVSNEA